MLNMVDLFAGIGGFSLAGHWTGGIKTVAFCEISKFPQTILKKNFPGVPIYDDVQLLTADRLHADGIDTVDIITGGFPCQDVSIAGKKAGVSEGTRSGLFGEILRLVCELRPKYFIMENVTNLLSGGNGAWFGGVIGGVAEVGYDAEWHCIPAKHVGALHGRDRVFIVAYTKEIGRKRAEYAESSLFSGRDFALEAVSVAGSLARDKGRFYEETRAAEFVCSNNGIPGRVGAIAAYGNSIVPQVAYPILKTIVDIEQSWAESP